MAATRLRRSAPDGKINGGLHNSGSLSGQCHDRSDLDNPNSYARAKCNNGWCAHMYDLYFEKDQAVAGTDCCGHRHDIEHVKWDERPENHYGSWQFPDLVSWNHYPSGIRSRLMSHNFGSASFAIKDGAFASNLAKAKPSGIPFNPHA